MDTISIHWDKTNIKKLSEYEECCFYAFTSGRNLLYIGMTWHQEIRKEVKQTIRDFDISTQGLSIWLGYIHDSTILSIRKSLIQDIECLLIHMNNPPLNKQCKSAYTGRDNLKIHSKNFSFIHKTIMCKSSEFYPSD